MANTQKALALSFVNHQQNVRELNTLHAATVALLNTIELEVLLDQALTVALRSIPAAERGMLLMADPANGQMQVRAVRGYADPALRPRSYLDVNGQMTRAVRERAPLI